MSEFEFLREPSWQPRRGEDFEVQWRLVPTFEQTRMSASRGLELLPKELPASSALGPFQGLLEKCLSLDSHTEDQIRVIYWTVALENAFEATGWAKNIPWFRMATYGFADPEAEGDAFGVIAYLAPSLQELKSRDIPDRLDVSGESFPIILRQAEWHLHVPNIHPVLGTSACWARSQRRLLSDKPAILTAKHVVGERPVGSSVPLNRGHGTLLDLAPEGIDAALVEVPRSQWPASTHPLTWQRFVAQWTDVDVYGTSSRFSTKITEVSSGRGTLDPSIPLRIFLATPGQSGDSGALVLDSAGRGVGLYMGSVMTPANVQEGFCQHLGQVAESLSVDLLLDP